jgi:hypothetical protein
MKKIVKFNESLLEDMKADAENEAVSEILDIIEKSVNSSDVELVEDFIKAYINEPETTIIEGLSNDSDIYEFYLKYTNDIDEKLNDLNYFEKSPNELGVIGLYDYLVKGTRDCIRQYMKDII